MSLYDDLGGEPKLREILQALYDKLFADRMVGFLFAGHDKAKLVEHQVWFTASFLGGPNRYEGRPLPEAHAALPLLPGHFDRRHHLLKKILEEKHAPVHVAMAWLKIDTSLKTAVLKSGEEARAKARS
jgi:hemoglobin